MIRCKAGVTPLLMRICKFIVTLLRTSMRQLQVAGIGSPRPNAGEGLGVRGTEGPSGVFETRRVSSLYSVVLNGNGPTPALRDRRRFVKASQAFTPSEGEDYKKSLS